MIDHADGCQVVHGKQCDCKSSTADSAVVQRAAQAIANTLKEMSELDYHGAPWVSDLEDLADVTVDGHVNLLHLAIAALEAAPATNQFQNYITLHGGPRDGIGYTISDAVVRHRRLYVMDTGGRVAIYESAIYAAGRAATCEARAWVEWHFTGYREDR